MRIFVPVTDDFPLDDLAGADQLVPYRCGLPCQHRMRVAAKQGQRTVMGASGRVSTSPTSRPRSLATPPFSSST